MESLKHGRTLRFIRETSPYFQSFLVEILKTIFYARRKNDIHGYRDGLFALYHSLPEKVKNEIIEELVNRFREIGWNVEVGTIEEIFDSVDSFCKEIMKTYRPGFSQSQKYIICRDNALIAYDILYDVIMTTIHRHSIFVFVKTVPYGEYLGI